MAGGLIYDDEGRVIGGWGNGQHLETRGIAGGSAGPTLDIGAGGRGQGEPQRGANGGPSRPVWGPNLPALRALRLWHWREAMKARKSEQTASSKGVGPANRAYYARQAAAAEKRVGLHIRFVQTLNDYFPPGDTAERDDAL